MQQINMFSNEVNSNNYHEAFKKMYYHLYSNSNSSRAERIISDITKLLLYKLAIDKTNNQQVLLDFLTDNKSSNESLENVLMNVFPELNSKLEAFSLDEESLRLCLTEILNINLHTASAHIIGDAFQAIIGPSIRGDKGQFFTPRNVVKSMIYVLDPKPTDKIVDPACGTGGFLSEAYLYQLEKYSNSVFSGELIGVDKDKDLALLSMGLLEISIRGKSNIINTNSLELLEENFRVNSLFADADIVITNPPFGTKISITDPKILGKYDFGYNWTYSSKEDKWYKLNSIAKSKDPQILFLELCIRMLKPGGKLGIILPEGVFGNKGYGFVWDFIYAHGNVIGMIDCPRTTFEPSTDVKTNILFFEKRSNNQIVNDSNNTWIAVAKNCGHDKRGRKTKPNGEAFPDDFLDIGINFSDKENSEIWTNCRVQKYYFVPRYYHNKIEERYLGNFGELVSFKELIDKGQLTIKSGHEVGSASYGTGDIPFIRTSDLNNFEISCDPTNSVSEEIYQEYANQQNLKEGDILFVADGRYRIGKTAILNKYNLKCIVQSHLDIISLGENAPITPYELLYLLNLPDVQNQIRNLIFIQSTLGTLGKRIEEIKIPIPSRTEEWCERIKNFKDAIEVRASLICQLQSFEHSFEL